MVWLSVWSVAGVLPLISVRGDGAHGLYFRGGIGPEIAHQTDVKDFFGPTSGIRVKYDPGLRISAAGGYQFCKYFSAELESGILYNSIKSITGSPSPDASVANVPLLANAVFHIPLESNFVPYCGFGFGGSSSVLTIDHATIRDGSGINRSLDGDDSDFVWAAQAFAGFRYEFNDRMGVGFGYKFLATGQPSWDVFSFTAGSGELRFDNARTHAFLAEFTLKF
jgi:opacity protein-like surface antigen